MKIYELEKLVNEKKLCCYEGLTKLDEIPEMVEQPFELWEKQGFFKELYKAEVNLARCGYSIDVSWEEDAHSVEYSIYKGLLPDHRVYVTMFSGNVFSWRQPQVIAQTLCSALGIKYEY